jgi:hypothetical protein
MDKVRWCVTFARCSAVNRWPVAVVKKAEAGRKRTVEMLRSLLGDVCRD